MWIWITPPHEFGGLEILGIECKVFTSMSKMRSGANQNLLCIVRKCVLNNHKHMQNT